MSGTEPTTSPTAPRWGLGDVAVGMIPFLLSVLTVLAGAAGGDDGGGTTVTVGTLLFGSAVSWIFLGGVPFVATRTKGAGPVRDLGLRFEWRDLAAFPLGVVLQAAVVPLLYWPILRLTDQSVDDVSAEARKLTESFTGVEVLVLVLVVCVGAPLVEELFYRGLLLRATERRWSTGVALAASTVLFGVAHLQGLQLPALLLFGLVAGLLTVRSGRLGPAVLCHAGFNATTLFILLVLDR